jgi:hypothetical protein
LADKVDYGELYAEMTPRLMALRPLFSLNENLASYRDFFDELLEANEFEVALHALCDFLMEPGIPGIGLEEIEEIEKIHQRMKLEDNCGTGLRAKSKL